MIRYYLYTEINKTTGFFEVHYTYNGEEVIVICETNQEAKNLFDEINAEKIGYPIP